MDFTLLLRIIFSPSIMRTFFYGNAHLSNGLYVLNLEQPKPIYNIDTKRFKSNDLNPTYFWHCRLGHVNEKRTYLEAPSRWANKFIRLRVI